LEIKELPACDGISSQPCNGACVTLDAETNGCRFIAGLSVLTDLASDEGNTFLASMGSTYATIMVLDPELGEMKEILRQAGDTLSLDLALTADSIYYVVSGSFPASDSLWRVGRGGGNGTLIRDDLPEVTSFTVTGRHAFIAEFSEPRLHRYTLDGSDDGVFERQTNSLVADGNDLYFLETDTGTGAHLYRATDGDVEASELIAEVKTAQILGFDADWIYAIASFETDAARRIHRFAKDGQAREPIVAIGNYTAAAFYDGTLLFTHTDSTREFVNTMRPDGSHRTIVGYLPGAAPLVTYLAMDPAFVYATKGFATARLRR
jgi:hypothetical protein